MRTWRRGLTDLPFRRSRIEARGIEAKPSRQALRAGDVPPLRISRRDVARFSSKRARGRGKGRIMKSLVGSVLCVALLAPGACNKTSEEKPSGAPPPAAQTPPPPPPKPAGLEPPADVAAAPADAAKTTSGLASKVLTPGPGKDHPGPRDKVKVHYTGWTTDGKMFDSSVTRGEPAEFRARPGHQGLDRGPAAHGRGREAPLLDPRRARLRRHAEPPARPPGMLVFDVELLDIVAGAEAAGGPRRREGGARRAPRRPRRASRTACSRRAPARQHPKATSTVDGALLGLDDRRQDVRQLGHARRAHDLPAQQRHQGLDRGRAAHERGREDALLDPGQPRLRRQADAPRRAARACSCSTSSCSASSSRGRAPR